MDNMRTHILNEVLRSKVPEYSTSKNMMEISETIKQFFTKYDHTHFDCSMEDEPVSYTY